MTTFIFTWSPEHWKIEYVFALKKKVEKNGSVLEWWRCHSKNRAKKNDRAFLVKVGKKPRGIFASGIITGETEDAPHWQDKNKQGLFRERDLLRASHIKPWRDSDNTERLDGYNELLLTPNLDALFGQGLISFADDGKILISDELSPTDREILGISQDMRLRKIPSESLKYLEYHRSIFFRK